MSFCCRCCFASQEKEAFIQKLVNVDDGCGTGILPVTVKFRSFASLRYAQDDIIEVAQDDIIEVYDDIIF